MKDQVAEQRPKIINKQVSPDKTHIYFNLIKPGESEGFLYYKKWDSERKEFSKAKRHPKWADEPGAEILGFQTAPNGVYARVKTEGLIKKFRMKELRSRFN